MTYKQTDVFLSAEDCAKIAPYIPADLLKEWEWWYSRGGFLYKKDGKSIYQVIGYSRYTFKEFKGIENELIPALDTGILGELLMYNRDYSKVNLTLGRGVKLVGFEGQPYFGKGTELQNRRDALMYLIDNGLIEEEK